MQENVSQPEQDTNEARTSETESKQDSAALAESVYEETHVPYLPQPTVPPPPMKVQRRVEDKRRAVVPSFPPSASGVNIGIRGGSILLGGILGGVLGFVIGGNIVLWGIIGAVVGGVIVLLPEIFSGGVGSWALFEVFDVGLDGMFSCCQMSAMLVIAFVVTTGTLLIGRSVFLAVAVGASIVATLFLGWSFVLLKHLLARRPIARPPHTLRSWAVSRG